MNPASLPSRSDPLDHASPAMLPNQRGKGFLAVGGSFVLWGLGQWIAGRRRRGVGWFCAWGLLLLAALCALVFPPLNVTLLVLVPFQIAAFIAMLVDAFVCGRRSGGRMLGSPIRRYGLGAILFFVGIACSYGTSRLVARLVHRAGTSTYAITSQAMRPTLKPGDRILTHRAAQIGRWDVVVFHPPNRGDVFTQRVVGLPGEKVEIVNEIVQINDQPVQAPAGVGPYTAHGLNGPMTGREGHPVRLRSDEYFLLGDNSPVSYDCRLFPDAAPGHQVGAIPRESILGRVTMIYWPMGRIHQMQ